MPPPKNAKEFLELVEKSQLMDRPKILKTLEQLREKGTGVPDDPSKLADALMDLGVITQFHTDQLLAGRHKGFMVGRYKILRLLGAGGMGRVYLAEHVIMRRQVALKILPKTKSNDPSALARFRREAQAVAALNHRNIVQAYDIDQEGELHYMVMEYIQGRSFQEVVKEDGPIDWRKAVDYVAQAAAGLEHAHESGLVHRDIKPGNLLLDRTETVKVLDMGLAVFFHKKHEDPLTLIHQENVLGTADYLAPEQALNSHDVDIRADIYSLGGTFYYMLTASPPFPEGTIAQKLLWHQSKQPKSVKEFVPDMPDELVAIFNKMMAKKPEHRYSTPIELFEALVPWRGGGTPRPAAPAQHQQVATPQRQPATAPVPVGPGDDTSPFWNHTADDNGTQVNPNNGGATQPIFGGDTATSPPQQGNSADDFIKSISDIQVSLPPGGRGGISPPKTPTTQYTQNTGDNTKIIIASAAGAVILLAAVLLFVFWPKGSSDGPNGPGPGSASLPDNTIFISEGAAPDPKMRDRFFKTLSLGWDEAKKKGYSVQIRKGVAAFSLRSTFKISSKMNSYEGGILEGESIDTVLKREGKDSNPIIEIDGVKDVVIRNLTLDGNGGAGPLILLKNNVENVKLENVVIKNFFGGFGVDINSVSTTQKAPLFLRNVTIEAEQGATGLVIQGFPVFNSEMVVRLEKVVVEGAPTVGLEIRHPCHHLYIGKGSRFVGPQGLGGKDGIVVTTGTPNWVSNWVMEDTEISNFSNGVRFSRMAKGPDLLKIPGSVMFNNVKEKVVDRAN